MRERWDAAGAGELGQAPDSPAVNRPVAPDRCRSCSLGPLSISLLNPAKRVGAGDGLRTRYLDLGKVRSSWRLPSAWFELERSGFLPRPWGMMGATGRPRSVMLMVSPAATRRIRPHPAGPHSAAPSSGRSPTDRARFP
jgi:hypothetical protein